MSQYGHVIYADLSLIMLQLILMPRCSALPGRALMNFVTPQARVRSETFLSEKRRAEFLWSRVLLGKLLQDHPSAEVIEVPPRSPRIEGVDFPETSISHTLTWIGVGAAEAPLGIDIEVMKPSRVSEQLFTRLFAKRHWDASVDRVLDFYGFFGMYEAAVKMNVPFISDCDIPFVGRTPDKACSVQFFSDGETLVTVVCEKPLDVQIRCFNADASGYELAESPSHPFKRIDGPLCLRN